MGFAFNFGPLAGVGGDNRLFNLRVDFREFKPGGMAYETANIIDTFTYTVTEGSGGSGLFGVSDHYWDEPILAWHFDASFYNPFLPVRSNLDTAVFDSSAVVSAEANLLLSATQHTIQRTITNVDGLSHVEDEDLGESVPNLSLALFGIDDSSGSRVYTKLGAVDPATSPADGYERIYSLPNLVKTYLDVGRGYPSCCIMPVLPGMNLSPGGIATEEFLRIMFLASLTRNLSIDAQSVIVGTIELKNVTWSIPNSFGGVIRVSPGQIGVTPLGGWQDRPPAGVR